MLVCVCNRFADAAADETGFRQSQVVGKASSSDSIEAVSLNVMQYGKVFVLLIVLFRPSSNGINDTGDGLLMYLYRWRCLTRNTSTVQK